ncbi:hypothetical protein NIES4073_78840 [Kalymmatonema gypsitolerans NIES-4073]|nr:hypothetical protein NIES4073_78840 [Scytonema sp. NIES-4073]
MTTAKNSREKIAKALSKRLSGLSKEELEEVIVNLANDIYLDVKSLNNSFSINSAVNLVHDAVDKLKANAQEEEN